MKKILIVIGTRPEGIKMAPLINELKKRQNIFETRICITGQHREMLHQVLDIFEIIPSYDLDIMKHGQDLYDITSRVLLDLKSVLLDFKPDIVLVHGDTTTSAASALAAYYLQIPVGHVEAGLRTHNIYSPFPEELNRQITSRIAKFHFAPTQESKINLLKEGTCENSIFITGNTVIDALFLAIDKIKLNEPEISGLPNGDFSSFKNKKIVLITGHRRENFGEGFESICNAIFNLASKYSDVHFVYPVHLNPNVQKPVYKILNNENLKNVHLIEPLSYLAFVFLMCRADIILTDSGGIQEEAPSLGKPVLVMRKCTERPEGLASGSVKLVGTDEHKIFQEIAKLLDDELYYQSMSNKRNPYGDGKACIRIINYLETALS